MAVFTLRVELAPFPDVDGPKSENACFGVGLVIAGATDNGEFAKRVGKLAAVVGKTVPTTPTAKEWAAIEAAFATHLPEILPWLWSGRAFNLYGSSGTAPIAAPTPIATPIQVSDASRDGVLRAILRSIHRNALATPDAPALAFPADEAPLARFQITALMAQSKQWPAPVPHLVLQNVFLFRVRRSELEKLGKYGHLFAVPSFTVGGSAYAEKAPPAVNGEEATWIYEKDGVEHIAGVSIGLELAALLDQGPWPPDAAAPGSFCNPFKQLWLVPDAADQSASSLAGVDWQSRLPSELESAAETAARLLEGLRANVAEADGAAVTPAAFRQVIGSLRDVVGPGVVIENGRLYHRVDPKRSLDAPPAVKLALDCRADPDWDEAPLDLWEAIGDGTAPVSGAQDDRERLAMLRMLCAFEAQAKMHTSAAWNDWLRKALPELAEWLPVDDGLDTALMAESPAARLDRLEAVYRTATDPPRHAALLAAQWRAAIERDPASADAPLAREFLRKWEERLVEVAIERDLAGEMRRATALALVPAVAGGTGSFGDRVRAALKAHSTARFAANSVLKPPLPTPRPEWLDGLLERAAKEVEEDLGLNRTAAPRLEPTPSPLVVQVDTLHDDSDAQGGKADLNSWLRGYSTFLRWRHDDATHGVWSCPHVGVIEIPCWSTDKPFLLQDAGGSWIEALGAHVVGASHGMRQVLVHVENRPWLRSAGITNLESPDLLAGPGVDPQGDLLVVVPRPDGTNPSGVPSVVPTLGFGLTYDVVPFGIGAGSALPPELTDGAPHVFKPATGWPGKLDARTRRSARYLRRVGVNAVLVDYPRREANAPPGIGPFDIPAEIPAAARSIDPEAGLDPTSPARRRDAAPPLVVLLSKEGFEDDPGLGDEWGRARFEIEAPDCSAAVYHRWFTGDRFRGPQGDRAAWKDWLERVDAADDLKQRLYGDEDLRASLGLDSSHPPRLHDPAVSAIRVKWVPLRSASAEPEMEYLPLTRTEKLPPKPKTIGDGDPGTGAKQLLAELERTNYARWKIELTVAPTVDTRRFAKDGDLLTVSVQPGEIGELHFAPGVADSHFDATLGAFDVAVPELAALEVLESYRFFPAQRTRVECATAYRPAPSVLYAHLRARAERDGRIVLRFDRDELSRAADGVLLLPKDVKERNELLAFDNLAALRVRWQAWRPAGKPQSGFPATQVDLDECPAFGEADVSRHAIAWDAEGFAERAEEAGTREGDRPLGLRENVVEAFVHEPGDATPRYLRMEVLATHRNEALYRKASPKLAQKLAPVVASSAEEAETLSTRWRRSLRPGRRETPIDAPAVKLLIPLTRPIGATGRHSSDLLAVLNEQWHLRGGLGETLECMIEPAIRQREGAPPPRSELGPDPILSGAAGPDGVVALPAQGPLGHTFDTDTREPLFVATSFVLRTSNRLDPFVSAQRTPSRGGRTLA